MLQGAGAALAAPAGLSLIAVTFPEGRLRTRALGLYAAMTGLAAAAWWLAACSPPTRPGGGFFVNAPVGLLLALGARFAIPESQRYPRLVRRVGGRGLGRFLREEVCGPLGLDFFVGLTAAEQARAVYLTGLDEYSRQRQAAGMPELYRRAVTNPPGAFNPVVVNGSAWRAAEVPAINGHGTARGAAGLYAALLRGKLLSPALLGEATAAQCAGVDAVFGHDNAWGLGFGVDADGFGMGGSGGSYAGASTVGGYALSFVTGRMGSHSRATAVENAFRGCLGMPPLVDF